MNYQKKYLKYKEKYLSIKNQIGGMLKIGDKVREYDSMVTGTIIEIGKDSDPLITMVGDDGKIYTHHSPHFGLLSFEYADLKAKRDNERDDIKQREKQREEQTRRERRDFLVGDRVWDDGLFRHGKITSIDTNGNIVMLSDDDGKEYSFEKKNIHFILKEETEEEKQRRKKDTISFLEARRSEAGRAGEARQSALAVATPVRLSGTNFEPPIKGTFNPIDGAARQLRVSPDDKSEFKSDKIQYNEALDILSCDGKFLFVRSNSKEGWVNREYVTSSANIEQLVKDRWHQLGSKIKPPIIVSTDNVVTLRARPSEGSEFTDILILPSSPLELLRDHGKFFKVKTEDGKEGFIRWTYIKEKDKLPPHLREVTRKAMVNRNDGKATFIKLREKPNESSDFMPVPDLPNGTSVDILEGDERNVQWYAEWEYVRFSPDRDTNVSGWVKKIYLQYL
jgi:hypothetical protein